MPNDAVTLVVKPEIITALDEWMSGRPDPKPTRAGRTSGDASSAAATPFGQRGIARTTI